MAGLTLILDAHSAGYESRREPHLSELAVTAAASLANAVYQLGQQVGLVTNGRDAADRIREEGFQHEFRTRSMALKTVETTGRNDRLRPVIVETRRGPEQLMRILETLARVELTDGLTFSELVIEATSRLPRDATIVALLPDVPLESAISLGNLKRRGYAVTALLIMPDDDKLKQCLGRLMSEGVDARIVENENDITDVCSAHV